MMKSLKIYDPAMCCSTGVCGPDVDPVLPRFAGLLNRLAQEGVTIERYNLGQQPVAFAKNAEVRAVLEKEGPEALPLIFIDDALAMKGRYPETAERAEWVMRAIAAKGVQA